MKFPSTFQLDGLKVVTNSLFNISPSIAKLFERRLLFEEHNPLVLLKKRIINHFDYVYRKHGNRSPIYAICENEPRLVSTFDNFDSLLIPPDHPSRSSSDTYYANSEYCLRAHTSAHQLKLLKQGLDNFIVIGDVFRRDEIDRNHFPCFHQMEGVRTFSSTELFGNKQINTDSLFVASGKEYVFTAEKQKCHSEDAAKILVVQLKNTLEKLTKFIFGENIKYRWIDAYFPFTHPSFELEILYNNKWLEVLGCGIIQQKILDSAGVNSKVGFAFGLGLERLAMALYDICDIRLFWSKDTGFLHQFKDLKPEDNYKYKPISIYPQLTMDLSFWIPLKSLDIDSFEMKNKLNLLKSNVYEVVRNIGGDLIEQVYLIDEFLNSKNFKLGNCYRIVYRSNERLLTKKEINIIHKAIESNLASNFNLEIR